MYLVGGSWIVFWGLVNLFDLELLDSALATGIIFLLIGLILERPWVTR